MMKPGRATLGGAALGLALLAPLAHADSDYISPSDDRLRVSLGVTKVSSSTTIRADSTTGVPGTVLDGENQFGLDKSDYEPEFEVMLRAGTRNRLWFNYFTLDRDGSSIVQEPIVFRDSVLQPGDPLQSELDLRVLSHHLRLFILAQREARARRNDRSKLGADRCPGQGGDRAGAHQ